MTVYRVRGGCGWLDLRAVRRCVVRYRCDLQRWVLGTARSRAGGVGKSLSALCCRVCNTVTRCARSVGSQVAQWWSGGVVRGNFDACVQRGRVCGLRSFTRGRGSGPRTDQNSEKGMSRPPPLSTVSTNLSPFVSSHAPLIAIIGFFPTQSAFWLRCPLRGVRTGRLASRASPLAASVVSVLISVITDILSTALEYLSLVFL